MCKGGKEVQFHLFLTLALDGCNWAGSHILLPQKESPVPAEQEVGWAQSQSKRAFGVEISLAPARNQTLEYPSHT
jgi:hypothetical protein